MHRGSLWLLFLLCWAGSVQAATIVAAAGAAGNWTAGAAWVGGVAPTAADDAQITATTTSLTIDSGAVARSVDFTGCIAGCTITHNNATLNIGDGTCGAGNVALKMTSGMTYTLVSGSGSAITFKSTCATQQTITTAGQILGNIIINGAGNSYQLQDNLTSSGSFTYTAGTTFDTNSKTMTLNGAAITFAGGSKTYFELNLTGSGIATVSGTNVFTNFNRTGTSVKTDALTLSGSQTISGNFTLAGQSAVNRIIVQSSVLGTQRTITNTGATQLWSNVDLQDMKLTTAYNAAAITGNAGDCQGNDSSITFTTPATQTSTGTASFSWSTHGWTSRVPLPQDDVVISNVFVSGRTVTLDMPRAGKSIDWSTATWAGTAPIWSLSGASIMAFGSITHVAGMTHSGTTVLTFMGRGSSTLTNVGVGWTNGIGVSLVTGTLTLADALSNTSSLTMTSGTLVDAGNAITATSFISSGVTTRTFTQTGNFTLTSTGTVWNMNSSGMTYTGTGSTITISETTQGTSKTFAGAGLQTYGNITFSGKNIIVTGANKFATMALNNLGDTTGVTLPASATTTVTGFTSTASVGNVAKLISSAGGTAATITCASCGTIPVSPATLDYLSIKDSTAAGSGTTWYAGANSTSVSGNSGWIFTAPPGGVSANGFFQLMQ